MSDWGDRGFVGDGSQAGAGSTGSSAPSLASEGRAELHGYGASSGRASLEAGSPWPLGASADVGGVNFAVFSANADSIELCLFGNDSVPSERETRIAFPARTGDVWHGYLPAAGPGLIYGFRAHGPWQPDQGHKFNSRKLLLDPYAREIVGRFEWRDEQFGFDPAQGPMVMSNEDSGAVALKARVVSEHEPAGTFAWDGDKPPRTSMADTVLYEVHVKGFTQQHPGVPDRLRGTYAGLASDAAMSHLKRLGVTAVSLLPVHQHVDEQRLAKMGLRNYLGYNTIGFFVPEPTYSSTGVDGARDEFREMVRALHAAGVEVILDVVFNHSAETDEFGPTMSWRGLDNSSYYRIPPTPDRAYYENQTGCGNTFDIRESRVLQMVMDSLRYWVQYMHVDGFRFDLAPVLARDAANGGFDRCATFLQTVAQDPVMRGVKLIAEPWDIGADGYRLGQFPAGWLEWNDKYRDTVRGFWLGSKGGPSYPEAGLGALAQRLCASDDVFDRSLRQAAESVNFLVAHDGFTLHDLVSYDSKHNEANGEENRDGHGHNLSWNCGVEGATDDSHVLALRSRLKRALLSVLLFSQGTPMLCAGEELGHSQDGNNNPYCQDNATSWIDWSTADESLIDYTAALIKARRTLMPLGADWNDHLDWLRPDGAPMQSDDWNDAGRRALACLVARPERAGVPLLLLLNGSARPVDFQLPAGAWSRIVDSGDATTGQLPPHRVVTGGPTLAPSNRDVTPSADTWTTAYPVGERSVALLAFHPAPATSI
ncbi:glycogen debranching protein GlgX [soil metagenome]